MLDQLTLETILENLAHTLPEIATRKVIHEKTGGLFTEKTMANWDCFGEGIQPRLRIGGRVAYPKEAVIAFLKRRCQIF